LGIAGGVKVAPTLEAALNAAFGREWLARQGLPEADMALWKQKLVLRARSKGMTFFGSLDGIEAAWESDELSEAGAVWRELCEVAQSLIDTALTYEDVPRKHRVIEVKPGIFELPQEGR